MSDSLILFFTVPGCKADPDTEVFFMFDTSDGVDEAQFNADKEFAAEASSYLAGEVTIAAAVYGGDIEDEGKFDVNSAQEGKY